MRAKTVDQFYQKAYVFDFDETIAMTDSKIHIYKNGRKTKSLTPKEFNVYVPNNDETVNFDDFKDPRLILKARKYTMWPAIENISNARKQGRTNSDIYILTARPPMAQMPINTFLHRNGIKIPLENVITIGNPEGQVNIPQEKKKELLKLKAKYNEVMFYDDDPRNIIIAGEVGIQSKLVDWVK